MNASKINFTQLVEEKIADLKSAIAAMKTNESLSKNTRGTQLYKLGRERRVLHLINALLSQIENVKLSEDDMDTFVLITTLAGERAIRSSVEVHEGDSIQELLEKYQDKKDILKKLQNACEQMSLVMNFKTGLKQHCKGGNYMGGNHIMRLIKYEPDVIDVRSSCSPVSTGYIADGG